MQVSKKASEIELQNGKRSTLARCTFAALPQPHHLDFDDSIMARRRSAPVPLPEELPEDEVDSNDESDAEDSSDGEPIVPLLAGREKRSNAGNRMRQLIEDEAEAEVEEMFKEEEDDGEFETKGELSRGTRLAEPGSTAVRWLGAVADSRARYYRGEGRVRLGLWLD